MNTIPLFKILSGSRLYGTNTKSSDFDYKVVILPELNGLLLGDKIITKKEKPVGVSDSAFPAQPKYSRAGRDDAVPS